MSTRSFSTLKCVHAELLYRAWQERAAARVGKTSKQRTAEAEHAAKALEHMAADLEQFGLSK